MENEKGQYRLKNQPAVYLFLRRVGNEKIVCMVLSLFLAISMVACTMDPAGAGASAEAPGTSSKEKKDSYKVGITIQDISNAT